VGLIFSFPSRVDNSQFNTVNNIQQCEFGKKKIELTLKELRIERDEIKKMDFNLPDDVLGLEAVVVTATRNAIPAFLSPARSCLRHSSDQDAAYIECA
jgi:hypothetical protein